MYVPEHFSTFSGVMGKEVEWDSSSSFYSDESTCLQNGECVTAHAGDGSNPHELAKACWCYVTTASSSYQPSHHVSSNPLFCNLDILNAMLSFYLQWMAPADTNFQMATQLNSICIPEVRRKFPASSSVEKVSDSRKLPSLIRPSGDASIQADWRVDKN